MRRRVARGIYGYVVMPEHVQLLVNEPRDTRLADAIHFLKLSFAKRLCRRRRFAQSSSYRLWKSLLGRARRKAVPLRSDKMRALRAIRGPVPGLAGMLLAHRMVTSLGSRQRHSKPMLSSVMISRPCSRLRSWVSFSIEKGCRPVGSSLIFAISSSLAICLGSLASTTCFPSMT